MRVMEALIKPVRDKHLFRQKIRKYCESLRHRYNLVDVIVKITKSLIRPRLTGYMEFSYQSRAYFLLWNRSGYHQFGKILLFGAGFISFLRLNLGNPGSHNWTTKNIFGNRDRGYFLGSTGSF